jgi:N-acetyl-anhydromuramyl-L-alanine amidase AmpD
MSSSVQVAQLNLATPRNTLQEQGPANARDYIVVAGEKRTVADARIVTYLDDPAMDFSRLIHPDANRKYLWPRRTDKGLHITDLPTAQGVVDCVVLHADITANSKDCFRILKMRGFSTHFMVDWDGTIYQSADPVAMAIHAASDLRPNLNNFAIGIDVNCLQMNYARSTGEVDPAKAGLAGQMASGGVRRMSEVIEINGVPWKSWGYTDAQYDALIKLLRELNVHFPKIKLAAPVDERGEIIWQVPEAIDTEKMGIYGHFHMTAQKFDPGPGFDWARLLQGLAKEHNDFPLELVAGVSIASLLTEQKVLQLAAHYYKNTEANELGGFYPMGLGGQWHGGVHLHAPRGTEVRAMIDGTVVAARNGPSARLGSNNFVLVRHEVPFDPADPKRVFVFYSLYMHLLAFDAEQDKSDAAYKAKVQDDAALMTMAPEWVSNARRGNTGKPAEGEEGADAEAAPTAPKPTGSKVAPKPAKPLAEGDEPEEEDPVADGEGADPEYKPFLDHGEHLAALKRGDVALFAIDGTDQTRVPAGKVIGRVGNFGDEQGEDGVLHVEIIADGRWRQIVDLLGIHSEFWFELEADTDDNLMVDTEDLTRMILPEAAGTGSKRKQDDFILSSRKVAPDDVQAFYSAADDSDEGVVRNRLRRSITRHVSEWSDQVDWFKSMAVAQGWNERVEELTKLLQDERGMWRNTLFAQQIQRQLPFMWLTADVAKFIGLDTGAAWDGLLYHFHPVHFVMWLTFHTNTRLRVLAKGMDKKQLLKLRAKEQKAEEDRRMRGDFPEDDDHGGEVELGPMDDVADPTEVLAELWSVPTQPGEWRRMEGAAD